MNSDLIDFENLKITSNNYWGPQKDYIFKQYEDVPFSTYNRLEKNPKLFDFAQRYNNQGFTRQNNQVEEEKEFLDVQSRDQKVQKKFIQRRPQQFITRQPTHQQQQQQQQVQKYLQHTKNNKNHNPNYYKGARMNQPKVKFNDPVAIKAEWEYLLEFNKSNIEKSILSNDITYNEFARSGKLKAFKSLKKCNLPKTGNAEKEFKTSTSPMDDGIILQKLQDNVENEIKSTQIYTTHNLLTSLMSYRNSEFPFDILVTKDENHLVLDKFDKDKSNYVDLVTVYENYQSALPEDERELLKCCYESSNVQRTFQNNSLDNEKEEWGFAEDENVAEHSDNKAFKYITVGLKGGSHEVNINVRCQLDAYEVINDDFEPVMVRSLNEFNPELDYENKIQQKGNFTTNEFLGNRHMISKWLHLAQMISCERIKIGYTKRQFQKENNKHKVLETDSYSFKELASIISFKAKDGWQTVKAFADLFKEYENGTYLLIKPANKQSITIYQIPKGEDKQDDEEYE